MTTKEYLRINPECPCCNSHNARELGEMCGHSADFNSSPTITLTTEWRCLNCDTIFTHYTAEEAI